MPKRKKSRNGGDQLSLFVVDVASGDMPADSVFRADEGKNPAADALRRMGRNKSKTIRAARHKQPRR
jgi:hypothetical protein